MNAYGLRGTFYINSGSAGKPEYLSLSDLNWIATNSGNEIAGATVSHADFTKLTPDQIRHEICDDRARLMDWGFPVRNFAYPFGYVTPEIEQIVASCGYNSAMAVGEVKTVHLPEGSSPAESCEQCAWAETVPPTDPFYVRAPAQVRSNWTVAEFQQQIANAQNSGGGWVQLTFHGICPTDCTDLSVAEPAFTELVKWLADQQIQGNLIVRTVGEVIGGPVQPAPLGPHS
jgi:peptidoglycan/xylan/chitin deacetylase (PgdA/CDA1 family)